MLHDPNLFPGDTADLITCLRLTPIASVARTPTIAAIRSLREVASDGSELPVEMLRDLVDAWPAEVKAGLGTRAVQIRSDLRRALRLWDDMPRRSLALRLRNGVPTLEDALVALKLIASADTHQRAAAAVAALAVAGGTTPAGIAATAIVVEPLLRASTPETFGVQTMKSRENKIALLRKSVSLVDPIRVQGREADVAALPLVWREVLEAIEVAIPEHEASSRAILRRLAVQAAQRDLAPADLSTSFVSEFVGHQHATHADSYAEKIRTAFGHWNAARSAGHALAELARPATRQLRQVSVDWTEIPAAIRAPIEEIEARAVSAKGYSDLAALVPDMDEDDLALGLPPEAAPVVPVTESGRCLVIEPETIHNWKAAIKRAWDAAHGSGLPTPRQIEDLYSRDVARAMVRGVRDARRRRAEAAGQIYEPKARDGRYEHSLLEALVAVGDAVGVASEMVQVVRDLALEIDPAIVSQKIDAQGQVKHVYSDRKIGPRHARMLRQFNDVSAFRRWFETPSLLWKLAAAPLAAGRTPTPSHVALARNALIARLAQRGAPLRRTNFARLRYQGPDPHLRLPVGDGEGTLFIPGSETKTGAEITVRIDAETVRLLRIYIDQFLPIARRAAGASDENPHLWPGGGGAAPTDGGYAPGMGYLTKCKLSASFRMHLLKHSGLIMDMHVMRHIAGKVILDQDPSAMSLVQHLLGHRKVETTRSYYAEVSTLIAQNRYLQLLDQSLRKTLAKVDFRVKIKGFVEGK